MHFNKRLQLQQHAAPGQAGAEPHQGYLIARRDAARGKRLIQSNRDTGSQRVAEAIDINSHAVGA